MLTNADQIDTNWPSITEEYAVGDPATSPPGKTFSCHFVDINDSPEHDATASARGGHHYASEACGNSGPQRHLRARIRRRLRKTRPSTPRRYAWAHWPTSCSRHSDAQNFGRKFKISYSGCAKIMPAAWRDMHDIGFNRQDRKKVEGKIEVEGFEVYVGGGLGSVASPSEARTAILFPPMRMLLPLAQSICARLRDGSARSRNRSQGADEVLDLAKLGMDEFQARLVAERASAVARRTRALSGTWPQIAAYEAFAEIKDEAAVEVRRRQWADRPPTPSWRAGSDTNVHPQQARLATWWRWSKSSCRSATLALSRCERLDRPVRVKFHRQEHDPNQR